MLKFFRNTRLLLAVSGLLVTVSGSAAQIPYNTLPDWSSSETTDYGTGCDLADINGDGWLDLAVSNGNDIVMVNSNFKRIVPPIGPECQPHSTPSSAHFQSTHKENTRQTAKTGPHCRIPNKPRHQPVSLPNPEMPDYNFRLCGSAPGLVRCPDRLIHIRPIVPLVNLGNLVEIYLHLRRGSGWQDGRRFGGLADM